MSSTKPITIWNSASKQLINAIHRSAATSAAGVSTDKAPEHFTLIAARWGDLYRALSNDEVMEDICAKYIIDIFDAKLYHFWNAIDRFVERWENNAEIRARGKEKYVAALEANLDKWTGEKNVGMKVVEVVLARTGNATVDWVDETVQELKDAADLRGWVEKTVKQLEDAVKLIKASDE